MYSFNSFSVTANVLYYSLLDLQLKHQKIVSVIQLDTHIAMWVVLMFRIIILCWQLSEWKLLRFTLTAVQMEYKGVFCGPSLSVKTLWWPGQLSTLDTTDANMEVCFLESSIITGSLQKAVPLLFGFNLLLCEASWELLLLPLCYSGVFPLSNKVLEKKNKTQNVYE